MGIPLTGSFIVVIITISITNPNINTILFRDLAVVTRCAILVLFFKVGIGDVTAITTVPMTSSFVVVVITNIIINPDINTLFIRDLAVVTRCAILVLFRVGIGDVTAITTVPMTSSFVVVVITISITNPDINTVFIRDLAVITRCAISSHIRRRNSNSAAISTIPLTGSFIVVIITISITNPNINTFLFREITVITRCAISGHIRRRLSNIT